MTKKHFIALADKIKWGYPDRWTPFHLSELADFCESVNPRFDRDRWLKYIAGTHGKNGGKLQ
jgi:hypothetical protein